MGDFEGLEVEGLVDGLLVGMAVLGLAEGLAVGCPVGAEVANPKHLHGVGIPVG